MEPVTRDDIVAGICQDALLHEEDKSIVLEYSTNCEFSGKFI